MADVDQLAFDQKELIEMMIKKGDIHEGIWGMNFNFGTNAGNFPVQIGAEAKVMAGALLTIQRIGIVRVVTPLPENALDTVDAAVVNPQSDLDDSTPDGDAAYS